MTPACALYRRLSRICDIFHQRYWIIQTKVYAWWKQASDILLSAARAVNTDLDSEDRKYNNMNTYRLATFYAYHWLSYWNWSLYASFLIKLTIPVFAWGRLWTVFAIMWWGSIDSSKTSPSTIWTSLWSWFDDALGLEQHWRRHSKCLPLLVWSSGIRSVEVHTHLPILYWPHPPLHSHTKYSLSSVKC